LANFFSVLLAYVFKLNRPSVLWKNRLAPTYFKLRLIISTLLGNGDGAFQPATPYTVGNGTYRVAIGDFNRDDKQDIVNANWLIPSLCY
ncbi:MAG: FG-GAP repeat domain-containing protein, partial [Candidatus Midichloria sp.]